MNIEDRKFYNGDRVRLNVPRIVSDPDYERKRTEYRSFVEHNGDTVFTVRREGQFCGFAELGRNGWLFWDSDLVPEDGGDTDA